MKRAVWATVVPALVAISATAVAATGGEATGSDGLTRVRAATAKYRNVDRAIADGYVQFFGCVHEPLQGSMGIHFVNGALVQDPALDPGTPEALTYEVDEHGRYRLTGVEYVVFKDAWDATSDAPPVLFGETLNELPEPNRYGIPAFYELHAWAWKTNPHGAHMDWNPTVLCPGTDGHV